MTTVDHRTPAVLENVEFVETTTGPVGPPPLPAPGKNPHTMSTIAGGVCTGIGLAGLVTTVLNSPDMVAWPIGATLAAVAATAVQVLRHERWQSDNAGVCEFVRAHNPA
ncbi:hypothetical protein ACQP2Y_21395 [Actinoplanes sp. CA-051413]|uniref:hypothetical protein n=1 Tax=Actinoplanes sp. CA-051413 TaxID=3239899 RepID=UPI003D9716B9